MTGGIEPRVDRSHAGRARRYLLDEMEAAEREAFELELLKNESLLEAAEMAEDALLRDYAMGRLSVEERVRAEQSFLEQSRLSEVDVIRAVLAEDGRQQHAPVAPAKVIHRPWVRRDLALAASAALVVGSSLGWLASGRLGSGGDIVTTELATSIQRSQGGATELSLPPRASWIRLVLEVPNGTAAEEPYRVEVLRSGTDVPLWTRDSLVLTEAGRTVVQCDVPKGLLAAGTFFVRVSDPATGSRLVETAFVIR